MLLKNILYKYIEVLEKKRCEEIEGLEYSDERVVKSVDTALKNIERLDRDANGYVVVGSLAPLNGCRTVDEQIINSFLLDNANYLLFNYDGHSGAFVIEEKKYIDDIETYILKSSIGFTNMFTTDILVYYNGNIIEYEICNENGECVDKNCICTFSSADIDRLRIKWYD